MTHLRPIIGLVLLNVACQEPILQPIPTTDDLPDPSAQRGICITDRAVQTLQPAADILFVVDNSGSMGDDQDALATNFPRFVQALDGSGIEYHVGVTTTDLSTAQAGQLREVDGVRFVTPDTPDPVGTFSQMVRVGTNGSPVERGLGATWLALELNLNEPENRGFYRPDASLHTVVVSDEDDQTETTMITLPEFVRWYDGLKDDLAKRAFHSVVGQSGGRYRQATEQIGGLTYDIADAAWGDLLEELGLQAAGLRQEFFLTQVPLVDTIEVHVERNLEGGPVLIGIEDWTYDPTRNAIRLDDFLPDPLDAVVIDYCLRDVGPVEPE